MSDNEQGSPAAQPEVKPENSESRAVMRGGDGMLILGCSFDEHQGEIWLRRRGGGCGVMVMADGVECG